MALYYINNNKDNKGYNEVHRSDCYYLSIASNKSYLGSFDNGIQAVSYAKSLGYNPDGCYFCCNEAHHG